MAVIHVLQEVHFFPELVLGVSLLAQVVHIAALPEGC